MIKSKLSTAIIALLVIVVAVGFTVSACGKEQAPSPGPKPSPTSSPAPEQKVIKLRMQTFAEPGTYSIQVTQETYCDAVAKATDGLVQIELVGGNAIVPNLEMHTAVGQGVIDIAYTTSLYFGGAVPAAKFEYGFPGQYLSVRDLLVMEYLGYIPLMRDIYSKAFPGSYLLGLGIDHDLAMASKVPLNRLADVKGVKMRAGGAVGDVMDKAGASVVMLPGSEIYTSLSTGLIDAVVYGSMNDIYSLGLDEVADYVIKDIHKPHYISNDFVNKEVWDSFPDNVKSAFELVAYRREMSATMQSYMDSRQKFRDYAGTAGKTIIEWPKEDFDTLSEYANELMEKLAASDPEAARVYEMVKEMQKNR